MDEREERFADLQRRMTPLLASSEGIVRTVVVVPSINLDAGLLESHAAECEALEERFLYTLFLLRQPRFRVAYVSRTPVPRAAMDYYLDLMPELDRTGLGERLLQVHTDDPPPRPLALGLLDRPDLLDRIRAWAGRADDATIITFAAKEAERDLALALDMTLYAPDHRFAEYGRKGGGRRLFAAAGVSHPIGVEGVRGIDDVRAAIESIRARRPGLRRVVVKQDDMVYGEGNMIVDTRRRIELSEAFVEGLARQTGIVEELIEGDDIRSPSVQVRITPDGKRGVVFTHDQILGGHDGQTFAGCRFPADPRYAGLIVSEADKVREHLAAAGVIGRFGVDFVVARAPEGTWSSHAVEINLREGGTTHPVGSLWLLTGGTYAPEDGYRLADGSKRHYTAADMVGRSDGQPIAIEQAVAAVRVAGLEYDADTKTGVVLHMLRLVEVAGRLSITAIGRTPEEADRIYGRALDALDGV